MSDVIDLVKGDSLPTIEVTLKDANTGEANDPDSWSVIDLSAGTTVINGLLRARNSTTLLATIAFTKVGDGSGGQISLPVTNIASQAVGRYEVQIEIDFNGSLQTVPQELEIKVLESFN